MDELHRIIDALIASLAADAQDSTILTALRELRRERLAVVISRDLPPTIFDEDELRLVAVYAVRYVLGPEEDVTMNAGSFMTLGWNPRDLPERLVAEVERIEADDLVIPPERMAGLSSTTLTTAACLVVEVAGQAHLLTAIHPDLRYREGLVLLQQAAAVTVPRMTAG